MQNVKMDDESIMPSKIVCIGRNYVDHIYELNNEIPESPVIFIKPNSSISNEIYASKMESIHYEAEISFLIRSNEYYAVGFGLDLTKRDLQSKLKSKGLPWERAKAFDSSAVFSRFVRLDFDIKDISLELYINDVLVQKADYSLMINKPEDILSEVNTFLTLEDGDIIMSGTPKGVGVVHEADVFTGKIYHADRLLIEMAWQVKE